MSNISLLLANSVPILQNNGMFLILLGMAVAPGIAIALFIYTRDRYEKEPIHLLVKCFLWGMLCVVPAVLLSMLSSHFGLVEPNPRQHWLMTAAFAFITIAASEEFCKFAVLRWYIYPHPSFNEPLDGIIYSVMISMGFATLENILYVMSGGLGIAILRMFLAVPAHATFAILMGYFVGMGKFRHRGWTFALLGWLSATLFHGSYDFFLFLNRAPLLALGAIVSLILGIILSLRAIRIHTKTSPFHPDQVLKQGK